VSPILVRPVREQLEHDRIIRLLPARYKRRFEVGINPGAEQNASIGTGPGALYPDAVLYSTEKSRKLLGVVEVETVESINHLEAMAEWAVYGRLKVPFHLYVPVSALDVARRLSSDHQVAAAEIWSFDHVGDQVRFTLVHKIPDPARPVSGPPVFTKPAPKPAPTAVQPAARPQTAAPKPASRPAKPAGAATPSKLAKGASSGKSGRTAVPARKAAPARKPPPARKPARQAAKAVPRRTPAASRGRAAATRKRSGASKRR
jgi:hypothetical protein